MKKGSVIISSIITLMSVNVSTIAFADNSYQTSSATGQPAVGGMQAADSMNQPSNGNTFLEQNKLKKGVVTLPDGLQYKIIKQGTGPRPTINDTVTVNYAGKLIDGKEFDSSYKRGEPATFPVNGVIPGWTEALQLMTKGSTWELYIPAALAYGAAGAPPTIGPNETLIFKVDLIDIKK